MSKYTTEVRFICESHYGLEMSSGCDKVDDIIAKAWNKIFTTSIEFFDEAYREVLCKKILKHYYLREICSETVGIWKLWMNTKLEEIMPYYNQLYKSALIEFNPMYDTDLTRKQDRKVDVVTSGRSDSSESGESSNTGSGSSDGSTSGTNGNTRKDLYSDTPQGGIDGIESERYLTNGRKVTDSGDTTGSSHDSFSNKSDGTTSSKGNVVSSGSNNSVDDYIEKVSGKNGGGSYSKMLLEFRETMLNIDMLVIDEFKELFIMLW